MVSLVSSRIVTDVVLGYTLSEFGRLGVISGMDMEFGILPRYRSARSAGQDHLLLALQSGLDTILYILDSMLLGHVVGLDCKRQSLEATHDRVSKRLNPPGIAAWKDPSGSSFLVTACSCALLAAP